MSSPVAPGGWSDEFDGPAGALPNPTKWTYDIGSDNGWGNHELQTYTDQATNSHLDGQGHLVIHVVRTPPGFTSARIKTQGRFAAKFGHVETRVKLPVGQGLWPAVWALGTGDSNWPSVGEIDLLENRGSEPSVILGTVHGPGYSGANALSASYVLPSGERFTDAFHTFAINWARESITFLVDGHPYHTVTPASLPKGAPWVFDAPFFLIINVAVGGLFPGPPNATTPFPQDMLVDYVRYLPET